MGNVTEKRLPLVAFSGKIPSVAFRALKERICLTLGRTRGGGAMPPIPHKVFLEFFEDDFSPAPFVFQQL